MPLVTIIVIIIVIIIIIIIVIIIFIIIVILSLLFIIITVIIIISTNEILFLPAFVCLSVCLFVFVCQQLYAKSYERILMKFSESVGGGTRKNRLDFESYR